ncbi:MAG: phage tail protein [Bryobacteraceae bacterium]
MAVIADVKELECPDTPLFLFTCTLVSGDVFNWSSHHVTVAGTEYEARVLRHNLFEMTSSPAAATDGVSKISVTLANADAVLAPIERTIGWKGAKLTVTFLFFSLADATPASDTRVVFRGIANAPDNSTEAGLRLTFNNRLNMQRLYLPETQVQKLCPWTFPTDAPSRSEALTGTLWGKFSAMYRCGYSPDVANGVGDLNGAVPFTTCDLSRAQCVQRGMFTSDAHQNQTARFGGIEFLPPSIIVRSYREKGTHISTPIDNQASYDDPVPLVYGTGWYEPSIVFARNDGNLTRMEVLLGAGEIDSVLTVVVNDIEIPAGVSGANMTATGWYNVVSYGTRNGAFDSNFTDATGAPLGDPYGSMAYLSVVVPNIISSGQSLPSIQVLLQGLKLAQYDTTGAPITVDFTNNPAWVLLDVLQRAGWALDEIDLPSFAQVAAVCNQPVQTTDLNGNATQVPRYQCNFFLTQTRSASDVVRGIRNGACMFLNFNTAAQLSVSSEDTLANQQATKPDGSNSTTQLSGGWPAYEFGDNSLSGIALKSNGQSSLRVYSRSTSDTPNRFSVEFQDEFNEYQQDSFSILDAGDRANIGQQIVGALPALGIPNFDQATRIAYLALSKSVSGNTYVDFDTSVKAVELAPGDIITITYAREGFSRQPFRIIAVAPGTSYRRVSLTAQIHDDEWYSAAAASTNATGRQPTAQVNTPRPLVGTVLNTNGTTEFGITESVSVDTDGTNTVGLSVAFSVPQAPAISTLSIPLVSLQPLYASTGGTLPGGATYYYAVSALDASGAESALSFGISATIPAGTSTNSVTLQDLSFSSTAVAFNVYRGATPANLLKIVASAPVAAGFVDTGFAPALVGPPDANFDHANFYWRSVLRTEQKADIYSANTVGVTSAGMETNEFQGAIARLSEGTGSGQERTIVSNTDSTLTVSPGWDIAPDQTSYFLIAGASWQFGATTTASPVTFSIPNMTGAVVEVSGLAANVNDDECAYALSPLTQWQIVGGAGSELDVNVPAQPTFGLSAAGQGAIEVVGIGFTDLTNTHGVAAGTLSVVYWDEVAGTSTTTLSAAVAATDQAVQLNGPLSAQAGDIVQVDSELMTVQQTVTAGTSIQVARGAYGTIATTHSVPASVYVLSRKTFVMPFPLEFFGTPASGDYSYRVTVPDVRIAAADFFVTNSKGNSSVMQQAFTATTDAGIRTLSGGQFSMQIEGLLAIQTNAVPLVIVDTAHSVRDIFANLGTAPTGAPVNLQVTQNGQPYCALSVPAGATVSNVVDGATLPPLQSQAQLGLNILAVPQTSGSVPGADLTVTIRL